MNKNNERGKIPLIVLIGSTGTGKSALAEQLGTCLPIEIINGDMAQMYTALTVGTAKPAWQSSAIRHHLFDVIATPTSTNAYNYRTLVENSIRAVDPEKTPVIVGGSTFYMYSLFFRAQKPSIVSMNEIPIDFSHQESATLWHMLYEIDPDRARNIHHNDRYRVERALTQWYNHKQKPSDLAPLFEPLGPAFIIHLHKERMHLRQDLKRRIRVMLNEGFVEEVSGLLGTAWEVFWREKNIIGYTQVSDYLRENSETKDVEILIEHITQKTVDYAKKQETFWRMLQKRLEQQGNNQIIWKTIDLTFSPADLYIGQLCKEIVSFVRMRFLNDQEPNER